MAKKKEGPKIVLERVYNVPLRKEFLKAPNWKRTPKAVKALRKFIVRHMKSDKVLLGKYVNLHLWHHGMKNPPHHVKVNAVKDDKGIVKVELVELSPKAKREISKQVEQEKKKDKKDKKETKEPEKAVDMLGEAKAGKEEKTKETQKEGIKELKKELPKQQAQKPAPQQKQVEQRPTAPKSQ